MVKLNKIYTRTGDKGTSGLANGDRVNKFDLRLEAYGTVDETNSCVGLARLEAQKSKEDNLDAILSRIQNDLFDLGADLSTPDTGEKLEFEPLRISPAQVKRLEDEIDALNKDLEPLSSFTLPGGSPLATALHLCRTVSRRAERRTVELSMREGEIVSEEAVQYLNRLSDLFFVMSRTANDNGKKDVLWVPGQNR